LSIHHTTLVRITARPNPATQTLTPTNLPTESRSPSPSLSHRPTPVTPLFPHTTLFRSPLTPIHPTTPPPRRRRSSPRPTSRSPRPMRLTRSALAKPLPTHSQSTTTGPARLPPRPSQPTYRHRR